MSDILNSMKTVAMQLDAVMDTYLPSVEGYQAEVIEAMRYAVMAGGKRIRPFLMIETARMLGYGDKGVFIAAAALECLHTYSLVHDDLPCMDDDDMRRGQPTVHKKYGEMIAVLAGDGLLTFAFELISHTDVHPDPSVRLALVQALAKASGTHGMIGGQVIDMQLAEPGRDETLITELQALKTGALIEFAVDAGGILASADAKTRQSLRAYARDLGLAFQIKDDILDVEGDATVMGKAARKDETLGKATFVSILGLEAAREKANNLGQQAKSNLRAYEGRAEILAQTVDFILSRER